MGCGVMTTYCLFHSSGQGPGGWELVARALEGRGHRVLTPGFQLDRTEESAAWHSATLVEALERSDHDPVDVVCVAHSASGMYLPLVAERFRPRRMNFLAALVPRPGVSIVEQYKADPAMFNPSWVGKDPRQDAVAREFVFHDCPPDRLEWALSTRIHFYARRALEEPCPLSTWPAVP